MKKSELKEYIKGKIKETLYAGQNTASDIQKDPAFSRLASTDKQTILKKVQDGGTVELAEMSRPVTSYTVAPDFRKRAETIKTGGPISPVKLKNVLDFLEDKETTTGPAIATGVGYDKQMPRIYPIFAALIERGALIPITKEVPVIPKSDKPYKFQDTDPDEPEEEGEVEDTYYKPDEDDDSDEKEPDIKNLTKRPEIDDIGKIAGAFVVDNGRLITSIIQSYKDVRSHLKEAYDEGDIAPGDFQKMMKQTKDLSVVRFSEKVNELVKKIKELKPEVQQKVIDILTFKFKSVSAEYVAKIIAKKVGIQVKSDISVETPAEVPIEDTDDEEPIAEHLELDESLERMQKLINYKG